MFGVRALRSRFSLGIVVGGMIAFALGAFTAKAYFARKQSPIPTSNANPFLIEGFDFNMLRTAETEWRGPDIGARIDLTRLRMKDGKTLASVVGKRPVVLVSVNPACAMCGIARDEMRYLREKLSNMDINYYPVFFASETPNSDFFQYSDSLKVGAPSFLWNIEAGQPPESLVTMTNPSHLLLNSDGTVIRVWPGSYKDKVVRDRMARQIVADTLVVIDTLNALSPSK
ncbi:MAG: hypothetical protein AABM67_16560 [Acidobacteriota bacterium]